MKIQISFVDPIKNRINADIPIGNIEQKECVICVIVVNREKKYQIILINKNDNLIILTSLFLNNPRSSTTHFGSSGNISGSDDRLIKSVFFCHHFNGNTVQMEV